jgi:hypothetical protein
MIALRRAVLSLVCLFVALPGCDGSNSDDGANGCPTPAKSNGGQPSAGGAENQQVCRTAARCVYAHGAGSTFSDEAGSQAACASEGGSFGTARGCAPAPGGGCCLTLSADGLAHVQTCLYEPKADDPASSPESCAAACGTWSTDDTSGPNYDTPQTPVTFVAGCDYPDRNQCVLYDTPSKGVECKEGTGVTSCPTDGLVGCCRIKGPILDCTYAGSGLSSADVEASCGIDGGVFWPTQASPAPAPAPAPAP